MCKQFIEEVLSGETNKESQGRSSKEKTSGRGTVLGKLPERVILA